MAFMAVFIGPDSTTSALPGFRFNPTDHELVRFYLMRKVSGKSLRLDPIGEIDIYKFEPLDLREMSKLKSKDLQWYFYTTLDRKYANSFRTNRATDRGYWKTTGKDRPVFEGSRVFGMKKTLVYHFGRAPYGKRTNWVMHEYRMADEKLANTGIQQDAFVLCRLFQKSGAGPRNGEQYGAPFREEDWVDLEAEEAPPSNDAGEEAVVTGDSVNVEVNNLEQNHDKVVSSESHADPINFEFGESSSNPEHSQEFEGRNPMVSTNGAFEPLVDQLLNMTEHSQEFEGQNPMVGTVGTYEPQHNRLSNIQELNEHFRANHDENPLNFYYGLGDHNLYSPFLETYDVVNPYEANPYGNQTLDEYLSLFNANKGITQYVSFASPHLNAIKESVPDQSPPFTQTNTNKGTQEASIAINHDLESNFSNGASSSEQQKDNSSLFSRIANRLLADIPTRPTCAAELHAISTLGKNGEIRFLVPSRLSHGPASGFLSGKTFMIVQQRWIIFLFCSVLILSWIFNIGSFI